MKKYYIIGGLVILAILHMAYVYNNKKGTISATGECSIKVPKDKFTITLNIQAVKPGAAESIKAAQDAANNIVESVKRIDDKTIEMQTKSMNSYEKTEWKDNSSIVLGIESDISIEISTNNKESITSAISNISIIRDVKILPNDMKNVSSHEVINDAKKKCLEIAVEDARSNAESIAGADGEKIGKLLSAEFGVVSNDNTVRPMMAKMASEYIQSSDDDLIINVNATFSIK